MAKIPTFVRSSDGIADFGRASLHRASGQSSDTMLVKLSAARSCHAAVGAAQVTCYTRARREINRMLRAGAPELMRHAPTGYLRTSTRIDLGCCRNCDPA